MTPDDTIRSRARGGHPTDEDLSALLDGEGGVDAHVRGCARCRDRVGELESAAQAVAAPVALPRAELRDESIARAVAAAAGSTSSVRSEPAKVLWLHRLRRPALAGGAVAAAVAAVLAFALLPNRETHDQQLASNELKAATTTRGGSASEAAVAQDSAAGAGALPGARPTAPQPGGASGGAYTVGGLAGAGSADLGDVNDGAALRARVGPAVQRRRAAGDEATTFAAPADSQRSGAPQPAAAPAAGGTAGSAASAPGETPPPYSGPPPKCEAQARALGPTADRLVYVATARWQETPAIVLAFMPEPPANGPARVYVMAEGDCRLLFSDVYEQ